MIARRLFAGTLGALATTTAAGIALADTIESYEFEYYGSLYLKTSNNGTTQWETIPLPSSGATCEGTTTAVNGSGTLTQTGCNFGAATIQVPSPIGGNGGTGTFTLLSSGGTAEYTGTVQSGTIIGTSAYTIQVVKPVNSTAGYQCTSNSFNVTWGGDLTFNGGFFEGTMDTIPYTGVTFPPSPTCPTTVANILNNRFNTFRYLFSTELAHW